MPTYFTDQELSNALAQTNADQLALIQQRLHARWAVLENAISSIWEQSEWIAAHRALNELRPVIAGDQFARLSEAVQRGRSGPNDVAQVKNVFTLADTNLANMEASMRPHLRFAGATLGLQVQEQALANAVMAGVSNVLQMHTALLEKARTDLSVELERIAGLKRDTVLSQTFGKHLADLKSNAVWSGRAWLTAFVLLLLGVPAITLHYFRNAPTSWAEAFPRVAFAVPLAVLVYFCFHEFKFNRLARIRYENLEGFISGGASEIGQMLVGAGGDAKAATAALHKQLAEILLNVDDLASVARHASLPTKEIQRIVVEIRKALEAVAKK